MFCMRWHRSVTEGGIVFYVSTIESYGFLGFSDHKNAHLRVIYGLDRYSSSYLSQESPLRVVIKAVKIVDGPTNSTPPTLFNDEIIHLRLPG